MFVIIGVLLAATAAQAEDRKCIRERQSHYASAMKKNYVTNPNEYGWSGIGPECRPERGKGFGWKQKKYVLCDCLDPAVRANDPAG